MSTDLTLLSARLAEGPLDVDGAIDLGCALMEDLASLHAGGVLHGEIRPSLVRITPTGVVLLRDGDDDEVRPGYDTDVAGAAAQYVSPEVAGLLHRAVDERSDLYAAGATLFTVLTGRLPFSGSTVGDVLRAQLKGPPCLREARPDVPRALQDVVEHLLRPEPGDRYQSASAAAADLADIRSARERGHAEPAIVIGIHDRARRVITDPALVERERELRILAEQLERARGGDGGIVLVEAESGGGKSRLLDECARRAAGEGARVLRGQARDQALDSPYAIIEGVVDAAVRQADGDPAFRDSIAASLAGHEAALVASVPSARGLVEVAGDDHDAPEEHGEKRAKRALMALLDAIGTPERPALVLLDDWQWADDLTMRMVQQWCAERTGRARHTLVVCAFRSEDVGPVHPLRSLPAMAAVSLAPLAEHTLRDLVASMAGELPEPAIETVLRLAEGSPFMAAEVVRGLVESGALVADPGGWRVEPDALADVQASDRAASVFTTRLERLDGEILGLLSVGAVLGKRFELSAAAELAGLGEAVALDAVDEACRRRVIWCEAADGLCTFVHDKLREALLARLGGGERRALHRAAASAIEERDPARVFDLAYHYDAAADARSALPYALAAADAARARYALGLAERQYRIAERGVEPEDSATRARIAEGLGDVAMLSGRFDEAEPQFDVARGLAEDSMSRAAIQGKIGELAFRRGDMRAAREPLEAALRLLGARVPRTGLGFLVQFVRELVVQVVHTLLPRLMTGHAPPPDERRLLALRLYSRLGHAYWFSLGKVACGWAHLREMNLAERHPATLELAQAWSEHAPVMTMIPWYSRGIDYGRRSLAIRQSFNDTWGQGNSLNFIGTALYSGSRFEEALATCEHAVHILERTGDQWETNLAGWHVALAQYRLGRLAESVSTARGVYEAAQEIGDHQAAGIALGIWSKASGGAVDAAAVDAALGHATGDVHAQAEILQAHAVRLLAEGDVEAAVDALREAEAAVRAKGLRQEYVAPVRPWLATALRTQLEAGPLVPVARRRLLRELRRAVRRAVRLSRAYRNNLPHALREAGLLAALTGRRRRAHRLLARSIAVAQRQSAAYEAAQSRVALARAQKLYGTPGADHRLETAVEAAEAITAGLRAKEQPTQTLSLVDRFATVLDAGRRITSALTREAVLSATEDAAMTLLRCERCEIRPADGLACGTCTAGAAGAGSVLCVPIVVRGTPELCLHASHEGVAGLLGQEEERLANFIVTLAGAALENAEFSQSLEERVSERTSLLAATLDSTADGILVVDRLGRIVSHNRRFARMWSIPDEIIERGDDELAIQHVLTQLTDPEQFIAKVRELYDDPSAVSWDELEFKDGRTFERYSQPQRIDGESVGRVWSFRDVTAQKRVVSELQQLDRIKTDFVSAVSHELRTPLTSIAGYVEMLRDGDGGEVTADQNEMLEVIERNAQRLLTQIEDLLTLSRIESGTIELNRGSVDLASILEGVVAAVHPQAQERSLNLRLDVEPGMPPVAGDASALDAAVLNLVSNAIKFSNEGGTVAISARREGDAVRTVVSDEGIGIPADEQQYLFTRFFRSSTATQRAIQGTGLGLVIVKDVIDRHGGTIEVDSEPGTGTTVTVTLAVSPHVA